MKRCAQWIGSTLCVLFLLAGSQSYANTNPTSADSSATASEAVSDGYITTKIKAKLSADSVTNPFNISVETNNGIVTLSGKVRSITEAATAVQLAEETDGVKNVDASNLVLDEPSQQPVTDSYITAKVKGVFIREKLMEGNIPVTKIKVETKDGIVYLSGNVDVQRQAKRAVELAKSIDGVSKVISTIHVGKESNADTDKTS